MTDLTTTAYDLADRMAAAHLVVSEPTARAIRDHVASVRLGAAADLHALGRLLFTHLDGLIVEDPTVEHLRAFDQCSLCSGIINRLHVGPSEYDLIPMHQAVTDMAGRLGGMLDGTWTDADEAERRERVGVANEAIDQAVDAAS
jgi:hypothetical protein